MIGTLSWQGPRQIGLKEITVVPLGCRRCQHFGGQVYPVDRITKTKAAQSTAQKARAGPDIQNRTDPAMRKKGRGDMGRQAVIHRVGKACIITCGPIGIKPGAILGAVKGVGIGKV